MTPPWLNEHLADKVNVYLEIVKLPMPGRRQKATDEDVFAAAQRAMSRRGPHELTLADIADEAGVTPGRLVQRFGSKRALLLALSERFATSAGLVFAELRATHRRPLATLRAYAACMADLAPTPDALLRNLAYLQGDLADDALRGHLVENARATRREIEALLEAAIAAGEVRRGVDVPALARTVETVIGGSLMSWATYREGKSVDWIGRDLEAVLAPWLGHARTGGETVSSRKRNRKKRRASVPRG
jgi:AcrR family transcriptional regulator